MRPIEPEHSCPRIDKAIAKIAKVFDYLDLIQTDLTETQRKKLHDDIIHMEDLLDDLEYDFEYCRDINDELRAWGEEMKEDAEHWEGEFDSLSYSHDNLESDVAELKGEIKELEDEISELEDELAKKDL